MSEITLAQRLAQRLKQVRKDKGLSLEATAKLSGVSRSMLSQIERGESSPTIATLWSLTSALQLDFAGLLDENDTSEKADIEIMTATRTPTIDSQGEGCRIRILSPPEQAGKQEIYEITLAKGGALVSEPHQNGCQEHLSLLSGNIEISAGKDSKNLSEGDTARYRADCPHAIRSLGGPAKAILVVLNS